ncbi:hypothetical protein [Paraburkholderia sp. J76]|uniref:hypothetical protein n=1 Tax=Paraburkholderia sp. J76 TaxID=2805439 RepID=UPI002ABD3934|nr:hypothetical protein [Paraburkholderia sp. J76]
MAAIGKLSEKPHFTVSSRRYRGGWRVWRRVAGAGCIKQNAKPCAAHRGALASALLRGRLKSTDPAPAPKRMEQG